VAEYEYSSILSNDAHTFVHLVGEHPCDACDIFMRGLHPDIKAAFILRTSSLTMTMTMTITLSHTTVSKMAVFSVLLTPRSANWLLKLKAAESHVHSTQKIVAYQMGQTFTADALTLSTLKCLL
jgi:hypothetical protein